LKCVSAFCSSKIASKFRVPVAFDQQHAEPLAHAIRLWPRRLVDRCGVLQREPNLLLALLHARR
jgi:hypothetical protein